MQYIQIFLSVIGVLSMIATQTPNKNDDVFVQKLLDIINMIGMNIGKSKNK